MRHRRADPQKIDLRSIRKTHRDRRSAIRQRLGEFESLRMNGTDERLWEEMVYCFFTGGCSAKMGLRSVSAVRSLLADGNESQLSRALTGVHRYPNARSRYIVASRKFLNENFGMKLRDLLDGFDCPIERRDWLVNEKGIKGLGYKEASHFLRNVGFKGYAILDKHVLRCLCELKIIDDPKPPNSRSRYLTIEDKVKYLAKTVRIDLDELDLVLWSMKTGEILK